MRRSSYPTGLESLPDELLQYLVQYRVVVCTSCKYAIQPKAIERHLKEIHRMKSPERQVAMKRISKMELADQLLVMQYQPTEFPVPLLPVYNGLRCKYEDCVYMCLTSKRMKHHWLSIHARQGQPTCDWQSAPLQTFFKGNLLRYFTGTPPEEHKASQRQSVELLVCSQSILNSSNLTNTAETAC
jgi:hypothetical protein